MKLDLRWLKAESVVTNVKSVIDFLESDGDRHVDPTVCIAAAFDTIQQNCTRSDSLKRKGATSTCELGLSVACILKLIDNLQALELWEHLRYRREVPARLRSTSTSRRVRRTMVRSHLRQMLDDSVTIEDVYDALDFAQQTVDQLIMDFASGLMQEDAAISSEQRYACSALLMALDQLFKEVWMPLRHPQAREESGRRGTSRQRG